MNEYLHNAHLPGGSFYWEGAETGILLLHGLTATTAEVRELATCLHQDGCTVSAPLLPGHGTTPDALNRVHWQAWAETAVSAYRQLAKKCTTIFVGGESTGAVLSLYLASLFPTIAGVLAFAPAIQLNMNRWQLWQLQLAAPFIKSVPKGSIDVAEKWQGYPDNPLKGGRELIRLQRVVLRLLPRITQPVLLVQGRHDTTIHPESGRFIMDRVRSTHKELHWMAHSSHVVLIDQELDAIVALTREFIRHNSR